MIVPAMHSFCPFVEISGQSVYNKALFEIVKEAIPWR